MSCLHHQDYAILGALLALSAAITTGVIGYKHKNAHDNRRERIEQGDLSQIEEKPFHHWFCGKCRQENSEGKSFTTETLKPDITHVTVKPVYGSDKVQQVVLETPQGERVRFVPKSHNEVTIETDKGSETFDLQTQTSKGSEEKTNTPSVEKQTSTNAWYMTDAPMSALREIYQKTRG